MLNGFDRKRRDPSPWGRQSRTGRLAKKELFETHPELGIRPIVSKSGLVRGGEMRRQITYFCENRKFDAKKATRGWEEANFAVAESY